MTDLYKEAGVKTLSEDDSMNGLLHWVNKTFDLRKDVGKNLMPIGFFANVVKINNDIGIAVSTDGVGTKLLLAAIADKYDTIGIDCIAMNVNDLICVGAEPISFVDYIAVGDFDKARISEIAKGLYEGCRQAKVNIPGGEIAQVKELLHSGESAFDIVGTAIGVVKPDKILTGKDICPGDILIGFPSTGIHSNGYTLARKVLKEEIERRDREILSQLLEPTKIYVDEAMCLLKTNQVKGMANITGEGLLNIIRLESTVEYVIDNPMEIPSICNYMQEKGNIPISQMYKNFNMGMGFVAVINKNGIGIVEEALSKEKIQYKIVGTVKKSDQSMVRVPAKNLIASNGDVIQI